MKNNHFSYLLIFVLLFIYALDGLSQDIIIKKDKKEIKCKIIETNRHGLIRYKEWDNLDGPILFIKISDVLKIIDAEKVKFLKAKLGNRMNYENSVSFGYINIFGENGLSIDFEHSFMEQNFSLRFPIYIAFNESGNDTEIFMSSGINLKYYLFQNEVIDFFAGPEVTIGSYLDSNLKFFPFQAVGNIGFSAFPADDIKITLQTGIGFGKLFSETHLTTGGFAFNISAKVGYQF